MRRVRESLEALVERLSRLGYRFGVDLKFDKESPLSGYAGVPLCAPPFDIAERIAAVEARHGVLPVSLRAFYEIVGSVDLRGYFLLTKAQQEHPDAAHPETLDPLVVYPLDADTVNGDEAGDATLYIAPDPLAKMDYSAVGMLELSLPCDAMDGHVWLEEPYFLDETRFMYELRRTLRYGGFLQFFGEEDSDYGLETGAFLRAVRTVDGTAYFDFLTRGLRAV